MSIQIPESSGTGGRSPNADRGTAVYEEGDFARASLNGAGDSERLHKALPMRAGQPGGRSGTSKTWMTSDKIVNINCTESKIPSGVPISCNIGMNIIEKSNSTRVYKSEDSLIPESMAYHASINLESDAEALWDALDISASEGRSGSQKTYQTTDKKVDITCTKSKLGGEANIPQFGCHITLNKSK